MKKIFSFWRKSYEKSAEGVPKMIEEKVGPIPGVKIAVESLGVNHFIRVFMLTYRPSGSGMINTHTVKLEKTKDPPFSVVEMIGGVLWPRVKHIEAPKYEKKGNLVESLLFFGPEKWWIYWFANFVVYDKLPHREDERKIFLTMFKELPKFDVSLKDLEYFRKEVENQEKAGKKISDIFKDLEKH